METNNILDFSRGRVPKWTELLKEGVSEIDLDSILLAESERVKKAREEWYEYEEPVVKNSKTEKYWQEQTIRLAELEKELNG